MTQTATFTGAPWRPGLPPGVYEDRPTFVAPRDVRLDVAAFVGLAERGPVGVPVVVESWPEFEFHFGRAGGGRLLPQSVWLFFENGGRRCVVLRALDRSHARAAQLRLPGVTQGGADVRLAARSAGRWGDALALALTAYAVPLPGRLDSTQIAASAPIDLAVALGPSVARTFVAPRHAAPEPGSLLQFSRSDGTVFEHFETFVATVRPLTTGELTGLARRILDAGGTPDEGELGDREDWLAVEVDAAVPESHRAPGQSAVRELRVRLDVSLGPERAAESFADMALHPAHPRFLLAAIARRSPSEAYAALASERDDPAARDGSRFLSIDRSHLAPGDSDPLQRVLDISALLDIESAAPARFDPAELVRAGGAGEAPDGAVFARGDDAQATTRRADFTGDLLDELGRYDDRHPTEPIALLCLPDLMHPDRLAAAPPVDGGGGEPLRFVPCSSLAAPAEPEAAEILDYPHLALGADGALADIADAQAALVEWCEIRGHRLAILDLPPGLTPGEVVAWRRQLVSNRAALYAPFLRTAPVQNPLAPLLTVPPSGAVCGIIARRERLGGVHRPPANETLRGVTSLHEVAELPEAGFLHAERINAVRVTENGHDLLGSRTTSFDAEWTHVSVRRLLDWLQLQLALDSAWATFEPNGRVLWSRLRRTAERRLRPLFDAGAFAGRTREESWFVRCDGQTTDPRARDEGRVVVLVGVAPAAPAEFLVFRLTQLEGGETRIEEARLR